MQIIYQIEWYDDEEEKETQTWGIATGKTLADAIKHVINYYGENNIIKLNIELSFDVLEDKDIAALMHVKGDKNI